MLNDQLHPSLAMQRLVPMLWFFVMCQLEQQWLGYLLKLSATSILSARLDSNC
jgi:hypothetical protein